MQKWKKKPKKQNKKTHQQQQINKASLETIKEKNININVQSTRFHNLEA